MPEDLEKGIGGVTPFVDPPSPSVNIDASVAKKFGLNGRINMLCVEDSVAILVFPFEESVAILKKQVEKHFAHKGERVIQVIQQNKDIIDALGNDPTIIRRVNDLEDPIIMKAWGNLPTSTRTPKTPRQKIKRSKRSTYSHVVRYYV